MTDVLLNGPLVAIASGQNFPRQSAGAIFHASRGAPQTFHEVWVHPYGKIKREWAVEPGYALYHWISLLLYLFIVTRRKQKISQRIETTQRITFSSVELPALAPAAPRGAADQGFHPLGIFSKFDFVFNANDQL
jgi:hypothetical protein